MFNQEEYDKDLEYQYSRFNFSNLDNKSILITGANGLICSYLIDLLMYANRHHGCNITIYALSRSENKLSERFNNYLDDDRFNPVIGDICDNLELPNTDYIIHGASNANPRLYVESPVETMNGNYLGMLNILNNVKGKNTKVVYISSGDVYGNREDNSKPIIENDYFYVDILNVRSSYASSKRATETLCIAFKEEYGINVSIVRPAHIYGPTYTNGDSRAISDFMRNVVENNDIIMKSDGSSQRSYCYVGDAVIGILLVMLKGENGEAYNITNSNAFTSIKDVASKIATYGNKKLIIELPNDYIAKKINDNVKNIVMSSDKLNSLGWEPVYDIDKGLKLSLSIRKK